MSPEHTQVLCVLNRENKHKLITTLKVNEGAFITALKIILVIKDTKL